MRQKELYIFYIVIKRRDKLCNNRLSSIVEINFFRRKFEKVILNFITKNTRSTRNTNSFQHLVKNLTLNFYNLTITQRKLCFILHQLSRNSNLITMNILPSNTESRKLSLNKITINIVRRNCPFPNSIV